MQYPPQILFAVAKRQTLGGYGCQSEAVDDRSKHRWVQHSFTQLISYFYFLLMILKMKKRPFGGGGGRFWPRSSGKSVHLTWQKKKMAGVSSPRISHSHTEKLPSDRNKQRR